MRERKIIHIDMDAFYASIEQKDDPSLQGRPVIVGGHPQKRGVVCAASYEARRFGVRSGMPSRKAHALCPQGVFLFPRFQRYQEISEAIRGFFSEVTPQMEPLSLDEAYLDVTQNLLNERSATRLARLLKDRIKGELDLSASAGVGPNKLVAKIASDFKKPDGLTVVPPQEVQRFLAPLPVEKLWGVGPATAEQLYQLGIRKIGDIPNFSLTTLQRAVGNFAEMLGQFARGIDLREVEFHHEPKSRGAETTFPEDILEMAEIQGHLKGLVTEVMEDLFKLGKKGRSLTLKIRYHNFETITRSKTTIFPFQEEKFVWDLVLDLLVHKTQVGERPIRLIGVSVGHLTDVQGERPEQLLLPFGGD